MTQPGNWIGQAASEGFMKALALAIVKLNRAPSQCRSDQYFLRDLDNLIRNAGGPPPVQASMEHLLALFHLTFEQAQEQSSSNDSP